MYYKSVDGREVLDATAGLWCCNAGHSRPRIVEAVKAQIETLDFAPNFSMSSPLPFVLAERLAELAPGNLNHVFYTNSGSESVDTALKMAIAYHRARGEGQRTRLIGREKGYHGVGFGGISVGGLPNNRKWFGTACRAWTTCGIRWTSAAMPSPRACRNTASSWPKTWSAWSRCTTPRRSPPSSSNRFPAPPAWSCRRGLPAAHPRAVHKHGILLIFDEVITGFGRVGNAFAAQRFDVRRT
jgi:beta-alanine--pyruvate transaminase